MGPHKELNKGKGGLLFFSKQLWILSSDMRTVASILSAGVSYCNLMSIQKLSKLPEIWITLFSALIPRTSCALADQTMDLFLSTEQLIVC